jgi:hypothetical protein
VNALSTSDLLYGVAAPAAIAALVAWLIGLCRESGQRHAGAAALAAGTLGGYFLLSLGPLEPESHWHWLPYVLVSAAAVGPVARGSGVHCVERIPLLALVSAAAMAVLVPTWEGLDPPRWSQVALWGSLAAVSAFLLDAAAARIAGAAVPLALAAASLCGAVVLALSGNLRFAQILGAATGACAGIALVAALRRGANLTTGIALPWTLLTAGAMLVGRVNSFSDVPLASYLLIPVAPTALLLRAVGPMSRWKGLRSWALLAIPLAICGMAVALALIADAGSGEAGDW